MKPQSILIAEDDAAFRNSVVNFLRRSGYEEFEFLQAVDGEDALRIFQQHYESIKCVILDFDMPRLNGIEAANRMSSLTKTIPIVIFSNSPREPDGGLPAAARNAMIYYVEKSREAILHTVEECVRPERAICIPPETHKLLRRLGIVYRSDAMQRVIGEILRLARTDDTILFLGPTGSGKNVCARLLHELSKRAAEPFKEFDCSYHAGDPQNFASSLYGVDNKAFTSVDSRASYIEAAGYGTLFIDECTEIPIPSQASLLGLLDTTNPMYRRYGSLEDRPVHCRIILASNRDIETEIARGRFKQDLFFRLTARIEIPPLSERNEDIEDLLRGFNSQYEVQYGRRFRINDKAVTFLQKQDDWPGNVRQLHNVFRAAAANSLADQLIVDDFRKAYNASGKIFRPQSQAARVTKGTMQEQDSAASVVPAANDPQAAADALVRNFVGQAMVMARNDVKIRSFFEKLERAFVKASLQETSGNVSKAERKLWGFAGNGNLKKFLRRFGIDPDDFKTE